MCAARLLFVFLLVSVAYSQTSCQTLYSFDGTTAGWYIDSSTVATGVASSTSYVTQGTGSIKFSFNGGSQAIYKVEGPLDVTGYRYFQFDLANVGGLTTIGFFVQSNTWTEASPVVAVSGQATYTFDLLAATWKTAASNWVYNTPVASLGSIQRIGIIFYSTSGANNAYVDNVRKCLAGTPSTLTATATPTPSPVTPSRTPTPSKSPVQPIYTSPGAGFVYPCGRAFCKDNCKYYYAGTNIYYLIYYGMDVVNNALNSAVSIGANVVRTWAFLDAGGIKGVSNYNGYWLQKPNSGNYGLPDINYGDFGLNHLDDVIYAAQQKGVKLILTFADNWRSFGGIDQYVQWWNMDKHDFFFTDTRCKDTYKRFVSAVLNRINHNTNIAYKNDPTIFGWELINEPRCAGGGLFATSGGCTTTTINTWVTEMSNYVRSIDTKHMIGVGDEGFFNRGSSTDWTYNAGSVTGGVDFDAYLANTNINFGTFHVYPDAWSKDVNSNWVTQWINDHAASGLAANKPVILEEYGWYNDGNRPTYFSTWLSAVYNSGVAGSNFWMLGTSNAPSDSYVVYTTDTTTIASFTTHKNNMNAKNTCP